MIALPLSDTPTVGLAQFIKESRFIVPNHQRDYSWTDIYVTAFLRDIEDALKNNSAIYFCGLMVLHELLTRSSKFLTASNGSQPH
jgi:uncharacterized protein with ParB-like and HNH nuclease domain